MLEKHQEVGWEITFVSAKLPEKISIPYQDFNRNIKLNLAKKMKKISKTEIMLDVWTIFVYHKPKHFSFYQKKRRKQTKNFPRLSEKQRNKRSLSYSSRRTGEQHKWYAITSRQSFSNCLAIAFHDLSDHDALRFFTHLNEQRKEIDNFVFIAETDEIYCSITLAKKHSKVHSTSWMRVQIRW